MSNAPGSVAQFGKGTLFSSPPSLLLNYTSSPRSYMNSHLRAHAYLVFPSLPLPSQNLVDICAGWRVHEARRWRMRLRLRLQLRRLLWIRLVVHLMFRASGGIRSWWVTRSMRWTG